MVLAFRGTEDWNDVRMNMKYGLINFDKSLGNNLIGFENVLVHRGFRQQYLSIKAHVRKFTEEKCAQYKPKQLLITGHSLGGALATLCSLDLTRDFY